MKKTPTKPKTPAKPRPLSVRQERFCEFIVAGDVPADAWIKAGHKVGRNVARSAANRALLNVAVKARIAVLRAPQTKKALLSKERQREILRDIAEDADRSAMPRLRAIEIDAKLAGFFAPDQVVVESGPNTLEAVRKRATEQASAMSRARTERENIPAHPPR